MEIKRITLDNLSTFLSKIKELIDRKLNKLKAGKNIKISGSTISAIDTIYDDTLVNQRITNVENSKLDNLTAGSNISIENNTISAVDTIYDDTAVVSNISALSNRCTTIEEKIPVQATSSNQLADKEFVNSSISTNTATFRGTYELIPQLTGDINDYIFVIDTDSTGNTRYNRYKNNGSEWIYEYSLNNSSFTANQWSAINSNITSSIVTAVNSHLDNTTIHVTALDKSRWDATISYRGVPIIDKTSVSGTSFAINPNKMYMFGTRTSLTISFNAGESDYVNEYMFQFTSGSTATNLIVPSSVKWVSTLNILANKQYYVSIENNLGLIGEWNV